MIGISKLYCGAVEPSDVLRYNRHSGSLPSHLLQFSADKKPVVVWNMTRRCNLKCIHCYSNSANIDYPDELTTEEGKKLIDDLAAFGSPVILFSGGEPLMRPDLLELAKYATDKGMRAVISTNGTLITREIAAELKKIGLSYVGVSLDGLQKTHDRFRGMKGAFEKAIEGIRNCREAGIKVGLRFTVNKHNVADVPDMFDLLRREKIERMCFYHLVYTGRGSKLREEDLTHEESRRLLDLIAARTKEMFDDGLAPEILTVDNHADGPYLYLKMKEENPARAREVLELLEMNEGNSTGVGIGCVSWDGEVYPDQFWRNRPLGNVRQRPFSAIWTDEKNEFLVKLKEKKKHVSGRCATCVWLSVCGGNFRARAEAQGDVWGPDPACYLTDEEISKKEDQVMQFPDYRGRRLRKSDHFRRLVRETRLSVDDLVYPLFAVPGKSVKKPIHSMPGQFQMSVDYIAKEAREAQELGIPALLLFGIPSHKDEQGSGAFAKDGIVQQAVRRVKNEVPDMLVITDVCLCEYTSHGHCGILEKGQVQNDLTLEVLAETALSQVKAGADMVAPSAMMDGQIAAIREVLDENALEDVPIMAYSAKYASAFYGPFREAAESAPQFGDRKAYQMDSANSDEAIREITLDVSEGADIIMVKPALAYLDVICRAKQEFDLPLAAYNVSGEYSMIKAAAQLGWLDEEKTMMESLTAIKRAGADIIITYWAKDLAKVFNR